MVFKELTHQVGVDAIRAHIAAAKELAATGLRGMVVEGLPEEVGLEFEAAGNVRFRLGNFGPYVLGLQEVEATIPPSLSTNSEVRA